VTTMQDTAVETFEEHLARLQAENHALRQSVREAQEVRGHAEKLALLEARNQELEDRLGRMHRLASLGTMAAMVAHEFNNILTPVVNYAELARKNPKMTDKAIARAADCGQRATDICAAILNLAGGDSPEPVEVNLAELVSETVLAMARDPKRDGIDFRLTAAEDLAVTTRKVELQQVLLNLLLNARTAVLKRTGLRRIEVTAERDGQAVRLRVRDNGVGIPPENLSRIFEPFFTTRPDDDAKGKAGHGLGLAICREIVDSLGGRIAVESQPDRGATFTLHLPT